MNIECKIGMLFFSPDAYPHCLYLFSFLFIKNADSLLNDYLICKREVEIGKIYQMKTQVFQLPGFWSEEQMPLEKVHVWVSLG